MKVGFLLVGPASDGGWNTSHSLGRQYLNKTLAGQVETTMAESVPENADAERLIEKMIAQGNKLIFATSFGYLESVLKVAPRHPDVIFMHMSRSKIGKNFGDYRPLQYQAMYLAGMTAGRVTKTNKLGFIVPHPIPPFLQSINAFTLGARSVNPKVEIRVVWTNSWSDQVLEAEAVKGLAESGVDVIASGQDNPAAILKTCESRGIYSVGFYKDQHQLAPKGWLTGCDLNWGPFYVKLSQSVIDHSWSPCEFPLGIESGCIRLATFGNAVPTKVKDEVLAKERLFKEKKFEIFAGPLADRDGKVRLKPGEKASVQMLANMDWFVTGVQGSLPNDQSKKAQ